MGPSTTRYSRLGWGNKHSKFEDDAEGNDVDAQLLDETLHKPADRQRPWRRYAPWILHASIIAVYLIILPYLLVLLGRHQPSCVEKHNAYCEPALFDPEQQESLFEMLTGLPHQLLSTKRSPMNT